MATIHAEWYKTYELSPGDIMVFPRGIEHRFSGPEYQFEDSDRYGIHYKKYVSEDTDRGIEAFAVIYPFGLVIEGRPRCRLGTLTMTSDIWVSCENKIVTIEMSA